MHGTIAPFPHRFSSTKITLPLGNQNSRVGTVTKLWAQNRRNQSLIPGRGQEMSMSIASSLGLALTQLNVQWL
jgi:hypothetical protein